MSDDILDNIETQRQQLKQKRDELVAAFVKAAQGGKQKRLSGLFVRIRQANDFLASLSELEGHIAERPTRPRYVVSSLFLMESFRKLTADQDEQFFFITGSEVGGVYVLDQSAEFRQQSRSMFGVTAEPKSTHALLIKLESFGHRLLAHFHSHPGRGAGATHPSGIDKDFQARLEAAGHVAIMAIFSRDGFVRFIRLDGDIDVEVFGQGVERHENGIFKLTGLG